jgi:predicted HTH transcriptional regulator
MALPCKAAFPITTALELVKTRSEITVKEIEESTGANRNTIKVHVKKLAEQQYLRQVGQGRGARYMIK